MSTEERQNIESKSQALDMNKWQIIVSEGVEQRKPKNLLQALRNQH